MFVLTAFTSILFAIPAALFRCPVASGLFAILAPVSFAVHAIGGARGWTGEAVAPSVSTQQLSSTSPRSRLSATSSSSAYPESNAVKTLVFVDRALAKLAGAVTVYDVARRDFCAFTVPFAACLAAVILMYYRYYPKPPAPWVAHHAAFHVTVVTGCLFAYLCGV